jgi:cytochrome c oxidase subunit 2
VLVMLLGAYALLRRPRAVSSRLWVLGGGVAFPTVVLVALLAYALTVGNALSVVAPESAPVVTITGKQWWWEVRYLKPGETEAIAVSANELHLPAGRVVRLVLESGDVIHSFWVPQLSGKVDMIPGRSNQLVLRAERPGVYRAQCAEYCGAQHAWMALNVVAHEPDDYERWIEREAQPHRGAGDGDGDERGRALFETAGCANCHTIRGTSAAGRLGPDLTHVARRLTLGAGALAMSRGALAGWIANSQKHKPGNLMPAIQLSPEDLQTLVDYVGSLR